MQHLDHKTFFYSIFLFLLLLPGYLAGSNDSNNKLGKIKTVVIDPGHGGPKAPGTVSKDNKTLEKDVTLAIGLQLGKLIEKNNPDIKVIYTRKTDVDVTLSERSAIANRNHADLFISIHINGYKNTSVNGSQTFVMGLDKTNANMEVSKLENSVIYLEDNYESNYAGFDPEKPESYIIFNLLQNSHLEQSLIFASLVQEKLGNSPFPTNRGVAQAPFLVLWKTTMPAVLIELGFMTNKNDLKVISDKAQYPKMAKSIYDAFEAYRVKYEKSFNIQTSTTEKKEEKQPDANQSAAQNTASQNKPTTTKPANTPATSQETAKKNSTYYTIQIATLSKQLKTTDPAFKGLKNVFFRKERSLYKYYSGKYSTRAEAAKNLPAVKSKHPDAFIISIKNEENK